MSEVGTSVLESATVEAVAQQLNEAMKEGRRQERKLSPEIQHEVDQLVHFGPRYLSQPSTLVILAVLVLGGTGGILGAVTARTRPTCALLVVLMSLGVFLLDQVRLMQRRDDALKAGLYVAVTNHDVPAAGRPVQDDAKS